MKNSKCIRILLLILVLLPLQVWAGFKPASPIKIYVTAEKNADGYTEQGVQDSVKDLRDSIRKKTDWWRQVDKPEDAQIVLEIQSREYAPNVSMQSNWNPATYRTELVSISEYRIFSELIAGTYSLPMKGISINSSASLGTWRRAAGDLLYVTEQWVKSNYDQLISNTLKGAADPVPSVSTDPVPTSPVEN